MLCNFDDPKNEDIVICIPWELNIISFTFSLQGITCFH